jgi:hypothetical protein
VNKYRLEDIQVSYFFIAKYIQIPVWTSLSVLKFESAPASGCNVPSPSQVEIGLGMWDVLLVVE